MKSIVENYSWLHSKLVGAVRHLPVSSKVFGPPKGIIPNMSEWVATYKGTHPIAECWYRKLQDPVEVHYPPARTIEESAFVFKDRETVRHPEIFAASIPKPRLLTTSGIVIAPDDRVFEQSCCWQSHFFTRDAEYNSLRQTLKPIKLPGSYITLISRHSSSFYHWFTECLLRLMVAESLPSVPILLQDGLSDWQRETLALLGIDGARIVELPEGCYEVDQLYFPSFLGYANFTGDWAFSWSDWALNRLRERFCGRRPANTDKRIYISRESAKHRRVINETEVVRALEREGFLIVDATPLTTSEKVELFGDAALIAGAHGAGLTHQLFAPAGAKIVEAVDPFHIGGIFSYHMGSALGQEYWYLFAENQTWKSRVPENKYEINRLWPFRGGANNSVDSRKGFDDLAIPVDTLLRTLEAANKKIGTGQDTISPEQ